MMAFSSLTGRVGDVATGACTVCGSDVERAEFPAPCLSCGHGIWFQWRDEPEHLTVLLGGEGIVTEQNVMRTLGRLENAMRSGTPRETLLDFGPVSHLTSTAVAHIVLLKRRSEAAGGSLRIIARRSELHDILRITRLDAILKVEFILEKPVGKRR